MTAKGTKSTNFNPIERWSYTKERWQQVDSSINAAKGIFINDGWQIGVPDNPDTGGDHDFYINKGMECKLVSVKSTTQKNKSGSPYISIRTNSKSKNNYGVVTIPKDYHYMIGISSCGATCVWTKEDLVGVKSSVTFGRKNGIVGKW